jgi:hypothetical protein
MVLIKWLGFAFVAVSVAVLPATVWISNDWGFASALLGLIGLALLGISLPRRRIEPEDDQR